MTEDKEKEKQTDKEESATAEDSFIKKNLWLQKLYYFMRKEPCDFELAYADKDENWSKWRKYSEVGFDFEDKENRKFLEKANNRTILPIEVVIDIEDKKRFNEVAARLEADKMFFSAYDTGSRGCHFHLWFNRSLNTDEKSEIIKKYGGDEQKAGERTMIALENCPHWKTGRVKTLVKENEGINILVLQEDQLKSRAEDILKNQDPLRFMMDTVKLIHIGDEPIIAKLICAGVSSGFKDRRKVIHSLEVGDTGKGKSNVQEAVSHLFTNTDMITSCSTKSQYYKSKAGKLIDNGIIIFDEAEFSEEAQAFERTITDDKITKPKHETISVDRKYVEMEISEINSVWKNAVEIPKDQQTLNRYHISVVDESAEQDNAVYSKTLRQFSGDEFNVEEHENFKICKLMTDRIKETSVKIRIPYGKYIVSTDKRNRRTIKKFLRLLYAVVYIYRFQRPTVNGSVIATRKDFEIALVIWKANEIVEQTKLTPKQQTTLEALPTSETEAIDLNETAKRVKEPHTTVRYRLTRLREFGFIDYKQVYQETKKYLYWRAYKDLQGLSIDLPWVNFKLTDVNNIDLLTNQINKDKIDKSYTKEELYEIIKEPLKESFMFPKSSLVGKSPLKDHNLKGFIRENDD